MKHLTLLFASLIILLLSCEKEDDIPECNVENPFEELEWMQDMINSYSIECGVIEADIIQARYKGSTVFYTSIICSFCNTIFPPPLFDCNGNIVKEYGHEKEEDEKFYKEVEFVRTVYSSCDE